MPLPFLSHLSHPVEGHFVVIVEAAELLVGGLQGGTGDEEYLVDLKCMNLMFKFLYYQFYGIYLSFPHASAPP